MKKQKQNWYVDTYHSPYTTIYIVCGGNASDRRKALRRVGRLNPGWLCRIV